MLVTRISGDRATWSIDGDAVTAAMKPSRLLEDFAARHGVSVDTLLDAANKADGFTVTVRPIRAKAADGTQVTKPSIVEALQAALELRGDELLITWDDKRLAALDVDFHDTEAPSHAILDSAIRNMSMRPLAWWRTHGGGLRLLWHTEPAVDADEAASMAALSLQPWLPAGRFELLRGTRHPHCPRGEQTCGPVTFSQQSILGALSHWRGSEEGIVTDDEVREFLEARGMNSHGRYPHELCPFDPCATGGQPPVIVSADGIFCHRCSGVGGARSRATWADLIRGHEHRRIQQAALGFVPWEHARYMVWEDYGNRFHERILRLAYRCLVRMSHTAGDPRVWMVDKSFGLVRGLTGIWLDSETLDPILPRVSVTRLAQLPSCQFAQLKDDGTWKTGTDAVELDRHATNQPVAGWSPIITIRGARLWGHWMRYSDGVVRAQINAPGAKYLPESKRVPWDRCIELIEAQFPGIDCKYLELALVARGFAESGLGMIPIILVTGPSGAGKTKVVELAAEILGDRAPKVPRGNYQETLGYTAELGGLLILDEFAKGKTGAKLRSAFDFLLELDREFTYRRLYVGPSRTRINSAIFVTNNAWGSDVLEHEQVGRRAVIVRLSRQAASDWQISSGGLEGWRRRHTDVCDSILSHVVDRWFARPGDELSMNFQEAAEEIGFSSLRNDTGLDGASTEEAIRGFFDAVCSEQEQEAGWVEIDWDISGKLLDFWRDLCDDPGDGAARHESMKIQERDLVRVLGVVVPRGESLRFYSRKRGNRTLVKFQREKSRKSYVTNGAIRA